MFFHPYNESQHCSNIVDLDPIDFNYIDKTISKYILLSSAEESHTGLERHGVSRYSTLSGFIFIYAKSNISSKLTKSPSRLPHECGKQAHTKTRHLCVYVPICMSNPTKHKLTTMFPHGAPLLHPSSPSVLF